MQCEAKRPYPSQTTISTFQISRVPVKPLMVVCFCFYSVVVGLFGLVSRLSCCMSVLRVASRKLDHLTYISAVLRPRSRSETPQELGGTGLAMGGFVMLFWPGVCGGRGVRWRVNPRCLTIFGLLLRLFIGKQDYYRNPDVSLLSVYPSICRLTSP